MRVDRKDMLTRCIGKGNTADASNCRKNFPGASKIVVREGNDHIVRVHVRGFGLDNVGGRGHGEGSKFWLVDWCVRLILSTSPIPIFLPP